MPKLVTSDLVNLSNETSATSTINNNFAAVETAMEKTLSRDGTSPNEMESELDMNNNHIINLPAAVDDNSPVTLSQLPTIILETVAGIEGSGLGNALTGAPLSQFAATTSTQLRGVISDETGTGALVFATSPTLVTPALGTPASGVLTNCTGLITSFNSAQYGNLAVNGFHQISQENGDNAGGTLTYPSDQWLFNESHTAVATAKRVATPFSSRLDIPRGVEIEITTGAASAASDTFALDQAIEGERLRGRLLWGTANAKPLRIGQVLRSNISGRAYLSVINSASNRSYLYPVDLVANTDHYFQVTVPGDTSGTWSVDTGMGLRVRWCFAAGSTFSAGAANAWNAGNLLAASDLTNFAATTGNKVWVGPMVVLPGLELPTFEEVMACQRHFDDELRACQRYWRAGTFNFGIAYSTTAARFDFGHDGMRTGPSVTQPVATQITDVFAANFTQSTINATITASLPNFSSIDFTGFTGLTSGRFYKVLVANTAVNLSARM